MLLEIPEPPEGVTWKFARIGQKVAETADGKVLIKRMEDQGILVEIFEGGGYELLTQPQVPPDAKIRASFKKDS